MMGNATQHRSTQAEKDIMQTERSNKLRKATLSKIFEKKKLTDIMEQIEESRGW